MDLSLKRLFQLAATDGVARIGAFIAIVLTARQLGPSAYGVFAYGYSAGNIAASVTEAGLTNYMMRQAAGAGYGVSTLTRSVVRLRLWLTLAAALVTGGAAYAMSRTSSVAVTTSVLAAALSLRWVGQSHVAALLGIGNARAGLVQQTWERLSLLIALVVLLSAFDASPIAAGSAFLSAAIVGWIVSIILWQRTGPPRGDGPPHPLRHILWEVWPLASAGIAVACFLYAGPLLLGLFATSTEAGEYGAILGLYVPLVGLPALVMKSVIKELAGDNPKPHARLALRRLVFGAVLVSGMLAIGSREITMLVLGPSYANASHQLSVMGIGAAASFVSSFCYYYLLARRRERIYTAAVLVSLALNLTIAPLLVHRWHATGAAVALVIAEVGTLTLTGVLGMAAGLASFETLIKAASRAAATGIVPLLAFALGIFVTRAMHLPLHVRLGTAVAATLAIVAPLARRMMLVPRAP